MDAKRREADPVPPVAPEDELDDADRARREADWSAPMSERLARLHELCKQMSAVKGSARGQ